MNIVDFVNNLSIGEAQSIDQLVILPIIAESDYSASFLTLEEALDMDVLAISEIGEGGTVPELLAKNASDRPIILLEGEELRGLKQNRVLNTTVIIPAGGEIVISVSCVEQGRWCFASRRSQAGSNVIYPSARRRNHETVKDNLRHGGVHRSDQQGLWSDIQAKSMRMAVSSDTGAASDILYSRIGDTPEKDLFCGMKYQDKQIGFMAFIKGGFAGGDIFCSPHMCEKQWKKLVKGYYLDVLDRGIEFPPIVNGTEEILRQISQARQEEFKAVGAGTEIRFENATVQGGFNLIDDQVAHLTVFPRLRAAEENQ